MDGSSLKFLNEQQTEKYPKPTLDMQRIQKWKTEEKFDGFDLLILSWLNMISASLTNEINIRGTVISNFNKHS